MSKTKLSVAKPKPAKKPKKPPTAEQLQQREQKLQVKNVQSLFDKLGYTYVHSDGIDITFKGRNGEIDGLFVFENTLLVVEFTIGKPDSSHLLKKKVLYDHILNNAKEFVEYAKTKYKTLDDALDPVYESSVIIKIIYVTKHDPSEQLMTSYPEVNFFYGATAKYFHALVNTIEKSARMEFLKYLGFKYDEIGQAAIVNAKTSLTYDGFLLPDGSSSYPSQYQVVSFYADPERLIARSYVLRRDGWRDESHLYQRILIQKKIKAMRKYLVEQKRVFVNNIIVTLPPETELLDADGKAISNESGKVREVSVRIPDGFDTIGLVDGQHRVFCYHEGSDDAEKHIKILRKRQNLMVTGIVYPKDTIDLERRKFEAKLFLEINDNQARARASLKHDIEVIITPGSATAIAKRVMQELGRRGPYKNMMQISFFDSSSKIKTSSIVSYGLRPLVKMSGTDSLFAAWTNPKKDDIKNLSGAAQDSLINEYVNFCVEKINDFFVAVKVATADKADWDLESNTRSILLSPTAVNGMISCLRKIIEDSGELSPTKHKENLKNMGQFQFSNFKSSQWQKLGFELYSNHYKDKSNGL